MAIITRFYNTVTAFLPLSANHICNMSDNNIIKSIVINALLLILKTAKHSSCYSILQFPVL